MRDGLWTTSKIAFILQNHEKSSLTEVPSNHYAFPFRPVFIHKSPQADVWMSGTSRGVWTNRANRLEFNGL